ncbi:unnamed protein product, partial [Polarella glacialis]
WEGFAPGILYFRAWHRHAKAEDVQLSPDLSIATGRGFLAATGMVIGTDEGLAVGDGPCRRWGTPGSFSSYFEVELDEIAHAPAGAGGIYVGVSIQSAAEIARHPNKEFDGWMIGGNSKALICRAGSGKAAEEGDTSYLEHVPDTFAQGASEGAKMAVSQAVRMLRYAMPPKVKGEIRELESAWKSDSLKKGDRIGILFKCQREGGARIRITVNGDLRATHNFMEAPPAEAIGLLTPVVRLAGSGKAAKLLPGLSPPTRLLADDS